MPDEHLNVCTFVNSGSEANDIAWRMAKHVTGNAGAIVMEGAYHGITNAIKPLSPSRAGRPNPPHVKTLKCPDLYRESLSVEQYAADVDRAIAELAADGMKPARFMLDSLFVSNGSPTVPDGYVAMVVNRCEPQAAFLLRMRFRLGSRVRVMRCGGISCTALRRSL